MRFTISASSGTGTSLSSSQRYPKILNLPFGIPFSKRFFVAHRIFSLMERLSSWAKDARMESINSPSPLMELIFSFSNRTSMSFAFRCLTVSNRSTVFLANRLMDLVRMMSIFPSSQSTSIRLNSSRLTVFVPEIKSSA